MKKYGISWDLYCIFIIYISLFFPLLMNTPNQNDHSLFPFPESSQPVQAKSRLEREGQRPATACNQRADRFLEERPGMNPQTVLVATGLLAAMVLAWLWILG